MRSRVVCSRAPVRIDFAGGWTDVPLFTTLVPGVVVNAAVSLYTYTTVESLKSNGVPTYGFSAKECLNTELIRMYSVDMEQYAEAATISDIEYDGTMDLVKAACKRSNIAGIAITTQADAPPGSGLGTSASLGVAIVGALSMFGNRKYSAELYARTAFELETVELGLLSGTQDQYAAALGGFNCFRCIGEYEVTRPDNLNYIDSMLYELEKRLVLVYTGKSRLSSNIHRHVVDAFKEGRNHTALYGLVESGELAREAFLTRSLTKLVDAINLSWENQKLLHESITNEQTEELFRIAKLHGMMAGKACGAGGGGCLLFLAERGKERSLRKVMESIPVKVLDFKFDFNGLQTWELFE